MGWGSQVRVVLDIDRSHGYRLGALASVIETSQPIGFTASWTYLEERLGLVSSSPDFLEPAAEALCAEHELYLEQLGQFSRLRVSEKLRGRRQPITDGATPRHPLRWHGDESLSARVLLRILLTRDEASSLRSTEEGAVVLAVAERLSGAAPSDTIARPVLGSEIRTTLQAAWEKARRSTRRPWPPEEMPAYQTARMTKLLLEQVHLAVNGAPVLGDPLTFVSPVDDKR